MTRLVVHWFEVLTWAFGKIILFVQILGLGLIAMIVVAALETREMPFVLTVPEKPIPVHAGQWAELTFPVKRDMTRRCSMTYERTLMDRDGTRWPPTVGGESAEGIEHLHKTSPDALKYQVPIPPLKNGDNAGIDPGPAWLIVNREYVCNPVQRYFPLRSTSIIPLEVLP